MRLATQQKASRPIWIVWRKPQALEVSGSSGVHCTGLLLPEEECKSVEPMAVRLCPYNVRQIHQSLYHVVAHAPWSDEDILETVHRYALRAMQKQGPIEA